MLCVFCLLCFVSIEHVRTAMASVMCSDICPAIWIVSIVFGIIIFISIRLENERQFGLHLINELLDW